MRAAPSSPAGAGSASGGDPDRTSRHGHHDAADQRAQGRIAVALLVAVWLLFTLPAFSGKARFPADFATPRAGQVTAPPVNPELGDAFFAFYPWHSYLGDRLRSGQLPLWDPFRFAGTPFAADSATGTFYPPNWLYAGGHVLAAFTAVALGSILLSLLLAYWFLRVVRLHPYAAAFGAVVWTFSAFLMKWSTNEAVLGSAIWLPLALGGLEVARRGRARRGTLLTAGGLALSLLAGHAQIALIVWTATAIWALVGIVSSLAGREGGAQVGARVQAACAVGGFAIALGIAAVQLLPTAQFAGLILRQETTFELARRTALPPEHAPTLVLPDYRGSPLDGNYAGPGVNYTETALYAGLLTLPLAALGLLNRPGRLAAFFLVITVVGLLATFGTPLYRVVLGLPGFSRTLFVTRFILLVDVGLAGLAAVGLHSLLVEPTRRSVLLALAPLAVLAAVLLVLTAGHDRTPLPGSYVVPRGVHALALVLLGGAVLGWVALQPWRVTGAAVVVLGIVTLDLWRFGFPFNPYLTPREIYPRSPVIESLASRGPAAGDRPRYANVGSYNVPPNGGLEYRLYGLEGYDPYVPRPIVELVALAEDQIDRASFNFFGPFEPAAFESPVMDLLGVRTAVAGAGSPLAAAGTLVEGTALVDRPTAFPPAFLASCWERLPDAAVLDRLRPMTASDLRSTAIVTDGPVARRVLAGAPEAPCAAGGDVRVDRYEPERVVLSAEAELPSVLVLTDQWFPGWQVRVDGERTPLLRVDHALRGVALPPGTHRVEFTFRPSSVAAGAVVTALTLLLVVAWVAVGLGRRRGADQGPDGPQ